MENILTVGGLAIAVLELGKWLFRKFVFKDMEYDFPEGVYIVVIPLLELLLQPLLVWLGVLPPMQDPLSFRTVLIVLLQSLVTLVGYNTGIKPLKEYAKLRRAQKKFVAEHNLDLE